MSGNSFLKKLLVSVGAAVLLVLPAAPSALAVDVLQQSCANTPDATLCQDRNQSVTGNSIYGPNGIITKAVKLLSYVVAVAAIVAIMIGGFKYIVSAGDSNSVNSAKNTILYAVIGLVVAALAQAIIAFVINRL